jgi:hypothetical protein
MSGTARNAPKTMHVSFVLIIISLIKRMYNHVPVPMHNSTNKDIIYMTQIQT